MQLDFQKLFNYSNSEEAIKINWAESTGVNFSRPIVQYDCTSLCCINFKTIMPFFRLKWDVYIFYEIKEFIVFYDSAPNPMTLNCFLQHLLN